MSDARATIFHARHEGAGAKFGPFAGYDMPLTYDGAGAIAEHVHTRTASSLFDVSHMGVVELFGDDVAASLERLVPGGITTLAEGKLRYTFFTNDAGGILDDLIVTNMGDRFMVVANAARKEHDLAHLRTVDDVDVVHREDLHLVAVQGPASAAVLSALGADVSGMVFLEGRRIEIGGVPVWASRSGYTGEDGFELALPESDAVGVVDALLADDAVRWAGLAARDSLRLEAGLCLYGSDLDETTTPVEADLMWAVPRRRREAADFPGADVIVAQHADGAARRRVGLAVRHRRPVRHGYSITRDGSATGEVTSGGFGPSVDAPIAMGYVAAADAEPGTSLAADARGTEVPLEVVDLPFAPHRYVRA